MTDSPTPFDDLNEELVRGAELAHHLKYPPQKQVAAHDGWSRCWAHGQPHYFLEGSSVSLCGSPANLVRGDEHDHPLTLTEEPDQEVESHKKNACPRCIKKLAALRKGGRR